MEEGRDAVDPRNRAKVADGGGSMSDPEAPAVCCVPLDSPGLSPEQAATAAAVFKALADPHRVRIVNLLIAADDAVCVCDLTPHLGIAQPTVSHHLKRLVDAGLLERERRGTWAYYSLNPAALDRVAALIQRHGARR
jgi:ArsR family transcriptional regulator, arsenate/arsenite/antimonite-responsive transcriptional repressor